MMMRVPIDDFRDRRDPTSVRLASVVRSARLAQNLTTTALAKRSGVSRGMIAKVESGECSPTTALLGRLCGALGTTVSALVARAEGPEHEGPRVLRAAEQTTWVDPTSGARRRVLSSATGGGSSLTEQELPPGGSIARPADEYAAAHHQVWVLTGRLDLRDGVQVHELHAGDSLELGAPRDCVWTNPGTVPCRFLAVASPRRG